MTIYSGLTLVANPYTALILAVGTEIADSRRFADLIDVDAARVQFKSSSAISVRIECSVNNGATWATLVPEDSYMFSDPYLSTWFVIPEEAKKNDVLLRAVGVGSGVLLTVSYVEMSFR